MGDVEQGRRLVFQSRTLTVEPGLFGARLARQHGLHPTDAWALIALADVQPAALAHPRPAGRLAQLLELIASKVTALVDRLQWIGHVRRQGDPADRRRI